MIMEEQRYNPGFRFLFERTSPEHLYYRWLTMQHRGVNPLVHAPGFAPVPISAHVPQPPWRIASEQIPEVAAAIPAPRLFSIEEWNAILSSVNASKGTVKN